MGPDGRYNTLTVCSVRGSDGHYQTDASPIRNIILVFDMSWIMLVLPKMHDELTLTFKVMWQTSSP
eukprot:5183373-Pyramimonas_sp.AAC.1